MSNPTTDHPQDLRSGKPVWKQPKLYIFLLMACYLLIICYVLYYPAHIGGSDNGDFIRYAGHTGIYGLESFSGDPYPYFYKYYDLWRWEPFDWEMLSPFYPQLSLVYPVSLIRLTTNIFGDTAVNPYQIWYLSLVCVPLLLTALFLLTRFTFQALGLHAIWLSALGAVLLLGSVHLCWFHSFYGESMVYLWFLLLLGLACNTVMAQKGSAQGKMLSIFTVVAAYMLLTAKAQTVLAYPIWAAITLWLVAYHWIGKQQNRELYSRVIRTGVVTVTALFMLVTGVGCYKLYNWNNDLNEGYTLFNSLFSGLLPIVDDPVETLDELGLDERLVQDVGKSGYAMDLLVIPNSPEGEEMVLSKVDTFDLIKYYITHPKYLYKALDISAVNAKEYFTWLFLEPYVDEYYPDEISYRNTFKFPLWEFTRKYVAPGSFLEYAGIYAALFAACIVSFVRQRGKPRKRMLCVLFMGMMLTGLIQFPLAYIGNGMADPVKQMYLFMLSFDLTILISIGWIFRTIRTSFKKRKHNKSMKVEQLEAIMSRLGQSTQKR